MLWISYLDMWQNLALAACRQGKAHEVDAKSRGHEGLSGAHANQALDALPGLTRLACGCNLRYFVSHKEINELNPRKGPQVEKSTRTTLPARSHRRLL